MLKATIELEEVNYSKKIIKKIKHHKNKVQKNRKKDQKDQKKREVDFSSKLLK